ncbi:MAG: SAM-dependent methyltransferase [Actinobacteria bacterium]|nr:SAM-dependent methyltransferase [Actinomycetota bacterium]
MVRNAGEAVYVSLSDVAEIADVGSSAVSNWRKRHEDFPAPRLQTAGGALFSLAEVERWLLENEKIDGPVPPSAVLWRLADAVRGSWTPEELRHFMLSALVYLVACQRAASGRLDLATEDQWGSVQDVADEQLLERLAAVGRRLEEGNPQLQGLLVDGFSVTEAPGHAVRQLLIALRAALSEEAADVELFHELTDRMDRADRFAQEYSTPDNLALLMVRLAEPLGKTVADLAAGNGGLLLMAAVAAERSEPPTTLFGVDINEDVIRHARAWFFIYDVDANLRVGNSLRMPPEELPAADTVVLDPPYGVGKWGDAELYLDDRWTYGAPPPSSADFAWLQLALHALRPTGRAVVLQPPRSTWAGGREGEIRAGMLDDGCIEGVIQLPERLRRNTSIPLTLWLLRSSSRKQASTDEILFVDASDLGTAGRHATELEEHEIDLIVELVHLARSGAAIPREHSGRAFRLSREDLEEGSVITPSRYRDPMEGFDVDALRARAVVLRAGIAEDLPKVRRALDVLQDIAGGPR